MMRTNWTCKNGVINVTYFKFIYFFVNIFFINRIFALSTLICSTQQMLIIRFIPLLIFIHKFMDCA